VKVRAWEREAKLRLATTDLEHSGHGDIAIICMILLIQSNRYLGERFNKDGQYHAEIADIIHSRFLVVPRDISPANSSNNYTALS